MAGLSDLTQTLLKLLNDLLFLNPMINGRTGIADNEPEQTQGEDGSSDQQLDVTMHYAGKKSAFVRSHLASTPQRKTRASLPAPGVNVKDIDRG